MTGDPAIESAAEAPRSGASEQIASDIAHDLTNALMPIRNLTAHLLRKAKVDGGSPKQIDMLNTILAAVTDAQLVVQRLHAFYRADEPPPAAPVGEATRSTETTPSPAQPSRLRILVIDDDECSLMVLRKCLVAEGHEAETFKDPGKGLERLASVSFDLVLTDRAMMQMTGDVVATRVKQANPDMPVILVTGYGDLINVRKLQIPGVDLVVPKPVSRDLLRDAISTVLQARDK